MKRFGSRQSVSRRHYGFASGAFAVFALFVLALAGSVWVSVGVVARERWPIRWLELKGGFQRVSAEQIRASLMPLIDTSFFTLDVGELHGAAGRNAWVSSIRVQKAWPDTVVVTVNEYEPLAHWNSGALVSSSGSVFAVPEADDLQGLPWLFGPPERLAEVLAHWSRFSEALAPLGLEVQLLRLDKRGAWSLALSSGTEVRLGRGHVAYRLQRLISSWGELTAVPGRLPAGVDLRYSNGFAVDWTRAAETVDS